MITSMITPSCCHHFHYESHNYPKYSNTLTTSHTHTSVSSSPFDDLDVDGVANSAADDNQTVLFICIYTFSLTFTMHWTNSAGDALMKFSYFFFFFRKQDLTHFMQIVFIGDNLHEMSKPFFGGKNKHMSFADFLYLECQALNMLYVI